MNKLKLTFYKRNTKLIIYTWDLIIEAIDNSNYMGVSMSENTAAVKNWKSVRKFIKLTNAYNEAIEKLAYE